MKIIRSASSKFVKFSVLKPGQFFVYCDSVYMKLHCNHAQEDTCWNFNTNRLNYFSIYETMVEKVEFNLVEV